MTVLAAGLAIFLLAHLLPVVGGPRKAIIARIGLLPYRGLFSLAALIGLVLIVWGYGIARESGVTVIYDPPVWMRHLVLLLMLPVFVLLTSAYLHNPISAAVRHPMVLAVKIWAFAHLLANGDVASLMLFGGFLVWGVLDRISLARRERAGEVRVRGGSIANLVASLVVGLAVYGLFIWKGHMWLIGVPVL
ncbi:MAG: NnrU family protein [Hyphomicrobiales bacterium]|nr:MAG: NnrU family protein [Hyphomicrobiales bacterium]